MLTLFQRQRAAEPIALHRGGIVRPTEPPVQLRCVADLCDQGRKPCPCPEHCAYVEQRTQQAADNARQAGVYEPPDDRPVRDGGGIAVWLALLPIGAVAAGAACAVFWTPITEWVAGLAR